MSIGSYITIFLGVIAALIGYFIQNFFTAFNLFEIEISTYFQGFILSYLILCLIYSLTYKLFISY